MSSEMKFFLSILAILGGALTLFGIITLALTGIGLGFMSLGLAMLACSAAIAQYKTRDTATYSPLLIIIWSAFLVVNLVKLLTNVS